MHAAKPANTVLEQLAKNIEFLSNPAASKIAVSTQEGIEVVVLAEIDYLKADRNYTLIKRKGKKDLLVSKTLKDFEETIPASQFMRLHSSYLVNLSKVQRYVRAEGGYAVMEDGTQITVSRSRKDDFLRYLKA
jgi:two-component system LytT family response regulator